MRWPIHSLLLPICIILEIGFLGVASAIAGPADEGAGSNPIANGRDAIPKLEIVPMNLPLPAIANSEAETLEMMSDRVEDTAIAKPIANNPELQQQSQSAYFEAALLKNTRPLSIQAQWQQFWVSRETDPDTPPTTESQPEKAGEGWRFRVQPYFLIPLQIDGEISADLSIPIDVEIPIRVQAEVPVAVGVEVPLNIKFSGFGGILEIERDFSLDFQSQNILTFEGETNIPISATVERSVTIPFELDLSDVLSFDRIFTISGRFEAWKQDFGLILGGYYTQLEKQQDLNFGSVILGPAVLGPITVGTGGTFGPAQIGTGQTFEVGRVTGTIGPGTLTGAVGSGEITTTVGPFTIAEINTRIDASFSLGYADLAVSYRIGEDPFADERPEQFSNYVPTVWFEPFAGVRVSFVDINVKFPGRETSSNNVFLEPLIGGQLGLNPLPDLSVGIRGDVSGLGIDTDLSWNLAAGFDWKISKRWSLAFGYRMYNIDFSKEDGDNLGLDLQERAIHIGASYKF